MSEVVTSHIELRPGPRGPRARIAGKGVLVQAIATWHHVLGMTPEEIAWNYALTLGEVYAALSYYHDHREEMEKIAREDDAFVEEMKRANPSLLQEKLRARFGQ